MCENAADRAAWRRLRGAALRLGPPSCSHGYCAIGLRAGSIVSLLPERRYALRPALGSAPPLKLSRKELEAAEAVRAQRRRMLKVEEARQAKLQEMSALGAKPRYGPHSSCCFADSDGSRRGQCQLCNGCAGYCAVDLDVAAAGQTTLSLYCVHCGCMYSNHEILRTPDQPQKRSAPL